MTTLLLPPRYTEDSIALWRAAITRRWSTERVLGWRASASVDDDVVIYGEPLFAATVAEQFGIALIEPPLDWLGSIPAELLRRAVRSLRLGEVRRLEFPKFVKPADDKCFPARVYGSADEIPNLETLAPETPTIVSDPVSWAREYRAFVLEGEPVTVSAYARDGRLDMDDSEEGLSEAARFVRRVATSVDVPPAVVLDVGVIANAGWAIVEANPCWGSGIYRCDPAKALDVVQRACRRTKDLAPEDARWIVTRAGSSSDA